MASRYGDNISVSVFGQSHSNGIGVCVDGFKAGFKIDFEKLNNFLKRRAPGQNSYSTPRKELDEIEVLSGVVDDTTCGAPFCAIIKNKNQHSKDYSELRDKPRPAHADYAAHVKYNGYQDVAGGGHFSGRLTAPICIAGGICLQMLKQKGISIGAHILSIGDIYDASYDYVNVSDNECYKDSVGKYLYPNKDFPVLDISKGDQMIKLIEEKKMCEDSIGGVIECAITGLPAGIGEPMFGGIENKIASIMFGIPAIKGIEFGNGFECASLSGSENNDEFYYDDDQVKTKTNNCGGILGGISNGMPIIFRVAIKPTPSIAKEQNTISFEQRKNTSLSIKGRHDPCIVPRAVPVVEGAAAIAILDLLYNN